MKKAICVLLSLMVVYFAFTAFGEAQESQQNVAIGDIITFGSYEQDNDLDDGPEPIEWIVLDVQDGKAFLLSKYGLESRMYNMDVFGIDITWEYCSLRKWLNNDFLNQAFTAEEQSAILVTEVDNSDAQGFDWSTVGGENSTGGINTQDQVFLLSYAEAKHYLGLNDDRNMSTRAAPTAYAIAQGAFIYDDYETRTEEDLPAGKWWLRSPGAGSFHAIYIFITGAFYDSPVGNNDITVRPALWVDLNSGIF